jgi:hypothetical protein
MYDLPCTRGYLMYNLLLKDTHITYLLPTDIFTAYLLLKDT